MIDFLANLSWVAIGQIVLIDLLLGGDNAILIALACRNLPPELRLKGILWGTVGAIGIRIVLIAFAVGLLQVPFLKLIGGLMLLWIGAKLLADNDDDHSGVTASSRLATAIRTIIVADLVMSFDNVVAVASAASQAGSHQLVLVIFGILVSIPIVVWGSTLVLKLMERLPVIILLGSGLLGYLGGAMLLSDVVISPWVSTHVPAALLTADLRVTTVSLPGLFCAVVVVIIGKFLARRKLAARGTH